jgi:hypothetical protein
VSEQHLNFFIDLIEYYNDKANTIQSQAREASIHDNKSDIGTLREDYLFDFLETHIPTRCNVIKGGFVFDSTGSKSSQIDLMVCNDQTFQFKKSGYDNKTKSFNCVEGCYAVISVKSYLNKLSLIDSLQNLASVSTTKKIKVNPFVSNAQDVINQIPLRIIFSYDGDHMETIFKTCKIYYDNCKKTGIVEPMPDLIIVNNEYYFSRAGVLGYKIHTGETIPYGEYTMIQKKSDPNVGAMGLFQLISRIMTVSTLSPYMEIDLNEYNKKIDETLLALHNKNKVDGN